MIRGKRTAAFILACMLVPGCLYTVNAAGEDSSQTVDEQVQTLSSDSGIADTDRTIGDVLESDPESGGIAIEEPEESYEPEDEDISYAPRTASLSPYSYSITYNTFTYTVDGKDADTILSNAETIIFGNEGTYNTVVANDNGACSLGKIQWNADNALQLMRLIVSEDNAAAYSTLGPTLYNEIISTSTSWESRTLNSTEVTNIKTLLGTDAGKTVQDKLADSYVAAYLNDGYGLGIRNAAALVYYADYANQYGRSGAKTCAGYALNVAGGDWDKITLNELHIAAVCRVYNRYVSDKWYSAAYIPRRRTTYGKVVALNWNYCNSGDYTVPYDENGYAGASWIQNALNKLTNAGLTVNGSYDNATIAAVKVYQKSKSLSQDGLAGVQTSSLMIYDLYFELAIYGTDSTGSTSGSGTDSTGSTSGSGTDSTGSTTDSTAASGTDIIKNSAGDWVYTVNGTPDYSYTGVAKNTNGWWYVENGVVDFSYNGFAENDNGQWYIENGKVTFKKNSVIQDTTGAIGTKGTWYYVVGSKVQTDFTGLADYKNENGWWYINDGVVNFSVDTVAKNKNGWYYVKNSKVDFSCNGFAGNDNGDWYIEKGKVTFNKNSVIKDSNGAIGDAGTWWYVVGSKVQKDFTGLADYKNENGWWYINEGTVNFSEDTVAKNKNGWYYVKNSKVDFGYNGFGGNDNGNWYIEKGKVTFSKNSVIKDTDGAIGDAGTWWYVVGSKVQSDFTGLADYKNENGWWYISKGAVDFTHSGVEENKNGWWYIVNGKVDFSYTGTVTVSGVKYSVENGKVDK